MGLLEGVDTRSVGWKRSSGAARSRAKRAFLSSILKFQDSETVAAFLTEYCRVPSDVVSSYKSPKNLVFQLMEKVKMMDPGAAELAASTPDS